MSQIPSSQARSRPRQRELTSNFSSPFTNQSMAPAQALAEGVSNILNVLAGFEARNINEEKQRRFIQDKNEIDSAIKFKINEMDEDKSLSSTDIQGQFREFLDGPVREMIGDNRDLNIASFDILLNGAMRSNNLVNSRKISEEAIVGGGVVARVNPSSDIAKIHAELDSLNLPELVREKLKGQATAKWSDAVIARLQRHALAATTDADVKSITDAADKARGFKSSDQAKYDSIIMAAEAAANTGRKDSASVIEMLFKPLKGAFEDKRTALIRIAKSREQEADGADSIRNFILTGKGAFKKDERSLNKFHTDNMAKMPLSESAALHAKHGIPLGPTILSQIRTGFTSGVNMEESINSLLAIRSHDSLLADQVAGSLSSTNASQFIAKAALTTIPDWLDVNEKTARRDAWANPKARSFINDAIDKITGTKDIDPLSEDEIRKTIGYIDEQQISSDSRVSIEQYFAYQAAVEGPKTKSPSEASDMLAKALPLAGDMYRGDGRVNLFAKVLDGHLSGTRIKEISTDLETDIRQVPVMQEQIAFASNAFTTLLQATDAAVAMTEEPVVHNGKKYIPFTRQGSTVGYLLYEPATEEALASPPTFLESVAGVFFGNKAERAAQQKRIIHPGTELFNELDEALQRPKAQSQTQPPTERQATVDRDPLGRHSTYKSNYVFDVDGKIDGPIYKGLKRLAIIKFESGRSGHGDLSDEEAIAYDTLLQSIMIDKGWDGLINPNREQSP